MSIKEYGRSIGVDIDCFEGNFYVSLPEYEKLLKEVMELREKNEVYEKLIRSAEC